MKLKSVAPMFFGLAFCAMVAGPVLAGEMTGKEILEKVSEKQYRAKDHGLKSISFHIQLTSAMFSIGGEQVKYMWKAPNHELCEYNGPDNPMMPKKQMETQMASTGRRAVGVSLAEEFHGYTLKAEMDGELHKVTGTTEDKEKEVSAFVLWINSDFVPVKQKSTKKQMGMEVESIATFIVKEHKGKHYIAGLKEEAMGMATEITMNWETKNDIFLATGLTIKSPMMGEMKLSFANIEVNGTIPDTAFPVQN